jgi:gas vesicle protein
VDWKKQLFWIICGAVLLIGVAAYFVFAPPTGESQRAVQSQAQELEKYGKRAKEALAYWTAVKDGKKPSPDAEKNADALKTAAHVKAAREFSQNLDAQKEKLRQIGRAHV